MDRVVVYDVPDEGKKCLSRDVWVFLYFERDGLRLDSYAHEERDSLRKKFKPRRLYNRISHGRAFADNLIESVAVESVPLPDWVMERAKELFFASMRVGKWDR